MSTATKANVPFSVFLREIIGIIGSMSDEKRMLFRREVATYFKQKPEPNRGGWRASIEDVIGSSSETSIQWPPSYLKDLKDAKGDIRRVIAFYYYLHSLTQDLSFSQGVDEIVYADIKEKTFAAAHGGMPVFPLSEITATVDSESWRSAAHKWTYARIVSKPVDGMLAFMSVECAQAGDTRNPIALFADVYIKPACEPESGIEIRFKSVDIALRCDDKFPTEMKYILTKEKTTSDPHQFHFYQDGHAGFPYVTLASTTLGLDGNYISDTLLTLYPNCMRCEIEVELKINSSNTNIVFPDSMGELSPMKHGIIARMVERGLLPRPNGRGHICLHELKYSVSAVASERL